MQGVKDNGINRRKSEHLQNSKSTDYLVGGQGDINKENKYNIKNGVTKGAKYGQDNVQKQNYKNR